jgi:excisionase family DNA binding protein
MATLLRNSFDDESILSGWLGYRYDVALDRYMLVKDAARELGVSDQQVRQLIRRARLVGEQLTPRLYLVERASVEAYKRERRPAGRPPASRRAER